MPVESYYLRFGNMSKIGQLPIQIPSGVTVSIDQHEVNVKGSHGQLNIQTPAELTVDQKENTITINRSTERKQVKAMHGLYRSLIANAVAGVEKPWTKRLEIVGTGFTAKMQGTDLTMKLGYSHPVVVKKPEGITFQVEGSRLVVVSGVDKQLVGQIAHQIKIIKKPDAYKGKGIRYEGEVIKLKPGKKAKGAE